jgi:hypothetical protein
MFRGSYMTYVAAAKIFSIIICHFWGMCVYRVSFKGVKRPGMVLTTHSSAEDKERKISVRVSISEILS